MIYRVLIFLILNFSALGLGSFFTRKGVISDWYNNLNKAPWTPPGWFFGFAWTTIMVCFAVYMAAAWDKVTNLKLLIALFAIQWMLNIAWNPTFFHFYNMNLGLLIISSLTVLMGYFLFNYWPELKSYSYLVLPYFIWLVIATSLNAYAIIKN